MSTSFQSFIPNNSLLKEYIYYFYTDRCNDPSYYRKYSFYPHIYTTLSFYNGSVLGINGCIEQESGHPVLKIATRQHSIQTVEQTGKIDKIGIVFKPLGLNHFLKDSYCSVVKFEKQLFEPSDLLDWENNLSFIFSFDQPAERISLLEDFLVSLYKPKEYSTLYSILSDLNNVENDNTIRQIAMDNGMSHRKLNRNFMTELGETPEIYRMIARFRYAVNHRIMSSRELNLTEIAYESGYLDQSYMIKTFKKLTGLTPRAFFEKGTHLGITDTFWQIDKITSGE